MFKYYQTRIYHRTVSADQCEYGFDEVSTIVTFQQHEKFDPENDIWFWAKSSEEDVPGTRTIWAGLRLFATLIDPAELRKSMSSFHGAIVDCLGHQFHTLEPKSLGVSSIDGLLDVLAEVSAIRQIVSSSREIVRAVNERTGFPRKQRWLCWLDNAIGALIDACNNGIQKAGASLTAGQPFAPDGTGDFVNPSLGRLECSRDRLMTGAISGQRELTLMRVPLRIFQSGEESFSGESVVAVKANKENNDSGLADRLSQLLAQKGRVLDNIEWVAPLIVQATDGNFWCTSNSFYSFSSGTAGQKELEVLAVSASEDVAEKYGMLEQAMYEVLETFTEDCAKYYKVLNDHGVEVWIKAENATPMAYA